MSSLVPPASAVADVLALHGLDGALTPPLTTIVAPPEPRLATVRTVMLEEAEHGPGLAALYDVLGDDLTGVAIVVAGAGHIAGAVWGEILSRAARLAGASLVVVDGVVRDRDAMVDEGVPVYGKGLGVVGPNGRAHAVAVDVPVAVAGLTVQSGDGLVADASGVVRLPVDLLDAVLDDAATYAAAEEQLLEALAAGQPLSSAYRIKRDVVQDLRSRSRTG